MTGGKVVKGTGWRVRRPNNNNIQCSLCKAPSIYIEPIPRGKIELLMEEYQHQEWLGYLVGQENKNSGDIFVEDLVVPPHREVSTASAEAEPFHIPKSCVGIIHSHHSMGAFHSGTDQTHVDRNFPVSITVARKSPNLEYDAVSYVVTPCGKGTTLKCPVKYVQPQPPFNKQAFLKEAKENIEKGRRVFKPVNNKGNSYLPIRYRDPASFVVDEKGGVMSGKDYEELMKEIWGRIDGNLE